MNFKWKSFIIKYKFIWGNGELTWIGWEMMVWRGGYGRGGYGDN